MSDKGKGFVLTPSRLGQPLGEEQAKPKFTGLKQSKLGSSLGILADSKLSSSNVVEPISDKSSSNQKQEGATPATFTFTPLTKVSSEDSENGLFSNTDAVQAKTKDSDSASGGKPVFGSSMVFGEKLTEKAVVPTNQDSKSSETAKEPEPSSGGESKDTQHLFSSVSADPAAAADAAGKTLKESAAEYTESHSNKRKYDEVAVVTGEEEESNVLQSSAKLHIFDTATKNWQERGRGNIRLNDAPASTPGHIQSRLVMRTHGSLRVVLNTKLWPEMVCEKVNEKNIRISAFDEDVIRIFLLTMSAKDAEKFHNALECRLSQLDANKAEEGEPSAKKDRPDEGGDEGEAADAAADVNTESQD